ncbi:H3 histone acetyltransferase RTT109 KNAG_0F02650 [Huiozyma naganishii CBS 8797]|uniref:histone acetyltransferase n=1 Tax=Huiozyma naganishii (strain ATCC MYA-139 / BCRC 22969 / CBS 8797 / KCTC 17520 / NBRC 10181 / NCYC 3082 / Yp74L-3) TaxID=1071383 RepID=J7S7E2_HUIN7|nr:hypothetical protein KNAG_0F02650 [Kazachstania naganishii CBS 8797]CCK70929.1 hypothetical protein KNAG_0F02650 [Kazachstania naganishii CBS 8797]
MQLRECVGSELPVGEEFQLLQLQSNPAEVPALFTARRSAGRNKTTVKTQHFFALCHAERVVFALEVYCYVTLGGRDGRPERLLFVSKADTNGYAQCRFSAGGVTRALLRYVLAINPEYYLQRVKPLKRKFSGTDKRKLVVGAVSTGNALKILADRIEALTTPETTDRDRFYTTSALDNPQECVTKLCLFTRPADHYLFNGSAQNSGKHRMNGQQLLDWWLHILDNILCEQFEQSTTHACLRVPGEEPVRIRRHLRDCQFANWTVGDIFGGSGDSPAVYHVPLFPDDPKSRFLHQLESENRLTNTTLTNFWTELQERQEFKLSVLVSVVGISGSTKDAPHHRPCQGEDVIVADSAKTFNYIKNYITAEDYDTEEGALEAFANIQDCLSYRMNSAMVPIQGQKDYSQIRTDKKSVPKEPTVTLLQPRTKIKVNK